MSWRFIQSGEIYEGRPVGCTRAQNESKKIRGLVVSFFFCCCCGVLLEGESSSIFFCCHSYVFFEFMVETATLGVLVVSTCS